MVVGNLGAQKAKRNDTPISAKKDIMLNDLAKKKAEQAKKMYLSKDPFYSAKEIASILNISTRTLYKYLRSVGVEPKQNQ